MKHSNTASVVASLVVVGLSAVGCVLETAEQPSEDLSASQEPLHNDRGRGREFSITSPSFESGDPLPARFSCEGKAFGEGTSPRLDIKNPPPRTKSFALVFRDTSIIENGPNPNLGYHWVLWNIPADTFKIPANLPNVQFPLGARNGAEQLSGGPGAPTQYFGPCPSWANYCNGSPAVTDNYSYTLYALPFEKVTPPYIATPALKIDPALPADFTVDGRTPVAAFTSPFPSKIRQFDKFFDENKIAKAELLTTSGAVPNARGSLPEAICPKP